MGASHCSVTEIKYLSIDPELKTDTFENNMCGWRWILFDVGDNKIRE